jgi:8-oxo-dGTP pyrophosphatase MutT (NUDIX family)
MEAAVLMPVYRDHEGELRIVLIVRGAHGLHASQLSFPGGKPEPGDRDFLDTALRETEEEVGVPREAVDVLAELEVLPTHTSGIQVHPFLGRVPADTSWKLRDGEVVGLLTPTVRSVVDPAARRDLPFSSATFPERLVSGVDVEGHVLWGFTLRMLDLVGPRLLAGEWPI